MKVGDHVRVTDGAADGLEGVIVEIDRLGSALVGFDDVNHGWVSPVDLTIVSAIDKLGRIS